MPRRFRLIPALLAFLTLAVVSGCASRKQAPKPQAPIVIGKVSLVNAELEFILVDTYFTPPAGTPLRTLSATGDETALLTVSREKRRPFIIANINDGAPQVGDRVIMEPKYVEEETSSEPSSGELIEPAAHPPQAPSVTPATPPAS